MKHLQKPKIEVDKIVDDCAASYRNGTRNGLKQKLIDSKDYLKQASTAYDSAAENGNWEMFKPHITVNGNISSDDMVNVYDTKFVRVNAIRNKYYDKIMSLARTGKCPICGIGHVSTLDHYLAKTIYPTYAITPYNLVPICRDCNFEKHDASLELGSSPLHPYYDDVDSYIWLIVLLSFDENGLAAKYDVNPEMEKDNPQLYSRMKKHMSLFGLQKAYSIQSATEIAEYRELWKVHRLEWKKKAFEEYLRASLESKERFQRNTWHTALLRALIKNIDLLIN